MLHLHLNDELLYVLLRMPVPLLDHELALRLLVVVHVVLKVLHSFLNVGLHTGKLLFETFQLVVDVLEGVLTFRLALRFFLLSRCFALSLRRRFLATSRLDVSGPDLFDKAHSSSPLRRVTVNGICNAVLEQFLVLLKS